MFELPNAKRVKRSKLLSSTSSSEDGDHQTRIANTASTKHKTSILDPQEHVFQDETVGSEAEASQVDTPTDKMQIDYGFEYDIIDHSQPNAPTTHNDTDTQHETTYAFNLFAPKTQPKSSVSTTTATASAQEPSTQPTAQITLRSPTPPTSPSSGKAGSILHPRPTSHYLTAHLPASTLTTLRSQYQTASITGAQIDHLSTTAWPGTHLPWRIITVPKSKLTLRDPSTTATPATPHSRSRPGKKRRIQLRQRIKAREAAKVAGVQAEVAEREKRTRRNREKKVKRKMREKAKKAEAREAAGDEGEGSVIGDQQEREGQDDDEGSP